MTTIREQIQDAAARIAKERWPDADTTERSVLDRVMKLLADADGAMKVVDESQGVCGEPSQPSGQHRCSYPVGHEGNHSWNAIK